MEPATKIVANFAEPRKNIVAKDIDKKVCFFFKLLR